MHISRHTCAFIPPCLYAHTHIREVGGFSVAKYCYASFHLLSEYTRHSCVPMCTAGAPLASSSAVDGFSELRTPCSEASNFVFAKVVGSRELCCITI